MINFQCSCSDLQQRETETERGEREGEREKGRGKEEIKNIKKNVKCSKESCTHKFKTAGKESA